MTEQIITQSVKRTIKIQAEAISTLEKYIDENFSSAVIALANSGGRAIISGVGKSAIIAQKMAATFNSTGSPAIFMHAADAIHGDLGMVQKNDIVIILSKSGDSPEIKVLTPLVKNFGNLIVGIVGNMSGHLARNADIVINTTIEQEACPNNLAPTTSTTVQMVMGDALAVCLMEAKGFTSGDFAKYHPGGMLGKKLYLRAGDMIMENENPMVSPQTNIKQSILEITKKRLGAAAVVDDSNNIVGIITDGDIRRMLEKHEDFKTLCAADIMGKTPKMIEAEELAINAFEQMKQYNISQLIVTKNKKYFGILHIHDLAKEGII